MGVYGRERREFRAKPRQVPSAKRSGWIDSRFVEWSDYLILAAWLGITLDELEALLELEANV